MADLPIVTDENFDELVLGSTRPVVVDLWAEWCAPCRAYAPAFEAAAGDLADEVTFAKLNTDEHPALRSRLDVLGIPTTILFNRGQDVARFSGGRPHRQLVAWIAGHIAPATEQVRVDGPSRTDAVAAMSAEDRTAAFSSRLGAVNESDWDTVVARWFAVQDSRQDAAKAAALERVPAALAEAQSVASSFDARVRPDDAEAAQRLVIASVISLVAAAGDPVALEIASLPLRGLTGGRANSGDGRYGDATPLVDALLEAAATADEAVWRGLLDAAAATQAQLAGALDGIDLDGDRSYRQPALASALAALDQLESLSDAALLALYGPVEPVIPLASLAAG